MPDHTCAMCRSRINSSLCHIRHLLFDVYNVNTGLRQREVQELLRPNRPLLPLAIAAPEHWLKTLDTPFRECCRNDLPVAVRRAGWLRPRKWSHRRVAVSSVGSRSVGSGLRMEGWWLLP